MPRYNVQREDGKWACFSTISNAYISDFVDEDKYEDWRKGEYGQAGYLPVRECNAMTVEESLRDICLNRSYDEAIKLIKKAGIATQDNIIKVLEIRRKYYEELEHDPLYDDQKVIS